MNEEFLDKLFEYIDAVTDEKIELNNNPDSFCGSTWDHVNKMETELRDIVKKSAFPY